MRRFSIKPALAAAAGVALIALDIAQSSLAAGPTISEGCMDQWMFNGIWRVQATKVEPLMDGLQQVGWQVTEVWRNGTSQEIAPGDSLTKPQVLELSDGTKLSTDDSSRAHMSQGQIDTHTFPAAAQFTYVQEFRPPHGYPDAANKPKALAISFDGAKLPQFKARPQFTSGHYDYRIKLDCTASATTAAGQGGSFEIPAKAGCMNQWMSNGLWRMRATAIEPYNNSGGTQLGWNITQEWTSEASQPIAPGDTNITDQQLVLASGNTMPSSAGVNTSASFGQLALHSFAPGSSFTYKQTFIQLPLDATDKPAKLIVTFDAAKEKLFTHRPQYTVNPPNFRIDLTCTK